MKTKSITLMRNVLIVSILTLFLSSCVVSTGIKTANTQIEFNRGDFEISEQFTAEAKVVRILGIDWKRLFRRQSGNFDPQGFAKEDFAIKGLTALPFIPYILPIIGVSPFSTAQNYALYNLLKEHEGYDIVIYPKFERDLVRIPFFYSRTKAKVTTRLGKLK